MRGQYFLPVAHQKGLFTTHGYRSPQRTVLFAALAFVAVLRACFFPCIPVNLI